MLLDIGAGNTEIGVFNGTSFVYTNTIPLGGDNITNDIALVLNISEEEAEKLGIKKKTLRNAKMELGIDSVKRGNQWYWMLSE